MSGPLGQLSEETFLRDYWQKRPLLLRQAFPGFKPELDANDIAGLACDELAESRLIAGGFPENDWVLEYGPFDEQRLRDLPAQRWTLLVQDVEKHYPPLRSLLDAFDFLPNWRIDDLMVSVAAPGGSVGPHTDQYDVFLLQAGGRRRWQIAESFDPSLQQGTELNVLESFEPEQEWVLEPGDMLYLPPGVAHHGVALDSGMTWSIGLRAPSAADLLQALGEWLAAERGEGPRYADPDLAPPAQRGQLDAGAIERFAQLAASTTGPGVGFTEFLGAFLSRYRLAHEPAGPPEPIDGEQLALALAGGATLQHNPWTRLLWIGTGSGAALFAAGQRFDCDPAVAAAVCDPATLARDAAALAQGQAVLLCALVNAGHLYLEEAP
jgi:50S ribosomal protein L16 3-hydroxylase